MLSNRELDEMRAAVSELYPNSVNILSLTSTSNGQGGETQAWGTLTRAVPCRLDQLTGHEQATDGSIRTFNSYELALAYDVVITTDYRVEVDGITYHVTSVNSGQDWQIETVASLEKLS